MAGFRSSIRYRATDDLKKFTLLVCGPLLELMLLCMFLPVASSFMLKNVCMSVSVFMSAYLRFLCVCVCVLCVCVCLCLYL